MQHCLVAIDGESKDLISKLRQPLLMRLSAAGPSFFELTRKVFFDRRRQGGTFQTVPVLLIHALDIRKRAELILQGNAEFRPVKSGVL